jgi:hypothetical protein
LGALHGTPAGRTKRWVKKICCVTTRRCNLVALGGLWRRWDALTARTFGLGMLGFDGIVLASPRLPPRRLPAPHQTQAFSILAVTLVPTPRLILAPTALAQTDPWPRSASAVRTIMTLAHGSAFSQGTARGERVNRSPRALLNTRNRTVVPIYTSRQEPDREGNSLRKA